MVRDIHVSKKSVIALALVAIYLAFLPVLLSFVPVDIITHFGIHINIFLGILLISLMFSLQIAYQRIITLLQYQIQLQQETLESLTQEQIEETPVELVEELEIAQAEEIEQVEHEQLQPVPELNPVEFIPVQLVMSPERLETNQTLLALNHDRIEAYVTANHKAVDVDGIFLTDIQLRRCLQIQLLTEKQELNRRELTLILDIFIKNGVLDWLIKKLRKQGNLELVKSATTSPKQKYKLIKPLIPISFIFP